MGGDAASRRARHRRLGVLLGPSLLVLAALTASAGAASPGPRRGGWIAFSSDETGRAQIYLVRPDGTGRRPLFALPGAPDRARPDGYDDMQPSWAPDGRALAFTQGVGYQSGSLVFSRIVVADADGSHDTVAFQAPGTVSFRPAWSPDGRTIAFVSGDPSQGGLHLELLDLAHCPTRTGCPAYSLSVLTSDRSALASTYPSWSPDGSRLVFDGGSSGDVMYSVPAQGGVATRLSADSGGHDYSPAWGRVLIAYSHAGPGDAGKHLWVMRADGSDAHPLLAGGSGEAKFPAWSPDGSRIVWSQGDQGCQAVGPCTVTNDYQLYVAAADGSHPQRITQVSVPETEFGESYPAWQPALTPPEPAARTAG